MKFLSLFAIFAVASAEPTQDETDLACRWVKSKYYDTGSRSWRVKNRYVCSSELEMDNEDVELFSKAYIDIKWNRAKHHDLNRDGVLSRTEAARGGIGYHRFNRIDTNHNGVISESDFRRYYNGHH